MKKNDKELKELAEFAAQWIIDEVHKTNEARLFKPTLKPWKPECVFFDSITAPFLAHLAKRKMEDMGFEIHHHSAILRDHNIGNKDYEHIFQFFRYGMGTPSKYNTNEYKALWKAIREAVENDIRTI